METTFDNLPKQFDRLLAEVDSIKKLMRVTNEKKEDRPKLLSFDRALVLITNLGFPISKSKLYKLCAAKKIPHTHFGNKINFETNALEQWLIKNCK